MERFKSLFILDRAAFEVVYAPGAADEIARRVPVIAPPQTRASIHRHPELLGEVELLFSGWGAPRVDHAFLDAAPRLKAIFYAAGAINGWATAAVWERDIAVTTANDANAIPVAQYTIATILFSLKHGWRLSKTGGTQRRFEIRAEIPGNYGSVVGLVGMGTIGRLVAELLRPFGMTVLTFDPFLSKDAAAEIGVIPVSLAELFERSDVVSMHVADLPSTRGMIEGALLSSMRRGATFINTSRGRVVREEELIGVLQERPDLQAVLDVTEQEPLPGDSPLLGLPNVVLTPHIAGSQGRECQRMGQYMVEELDRYLAGESLRWQVRKGQLGHSVHFLRIG